MKNVKFNSPNKNVKLIDTMTNKKHGTCWGHSLGERISHWHWAEERDKKHRALFNRPRLQKGE